MDILKWRSSYETGIPSMDEQHKKLIDLVNTMYRVMRGSENISSVDEVLEEMEKYAQIHFRDEEELLQKHNYTAFESHIAAHQIYREKIAVLLKEMKEDESRKGTVEKQLYSFLRQWWIEHIVQEDKEYGAFLKEKGCS